MRGTIRRVFSHVLPLAIMLSCPAAVQAQAYPTKPVRIIVPFAPGGSSDILARLLGASLRERWGQPAIIENRAGLGGVIGIDLVAKAPPDGYTLVLTDLGALSVSPVLLKTMPFDADKDVAAVVALTYSPYFVAVTPSLPVRTLAELVEYSKANPGKLNYATPGIGSNAHLAGVQFARAIGVEWTFIPSKGGAQAVQDVAAGTADLLFNSRLATAPHVTSGRLRLLSITSAKRTEGYADIPAASELVPGFTAGSYQGVFTTGGTPRALIAKLNADIASVLSTPAMKEKIAGLGAEPIPNTPEHLDHWMRDDRERWTKVVREAKIKVD